MNVSVIVWSGWHLRKWCRATVTMAGTNYFLEIEPEFVKFILSLLGVEEVGRAACVCREFYKELTPRAKTIVRAIQWIEKQTGKKWGDRVTTSLTRLYIFDKQITHLISNQVSNEETTEQNKLVIQNCCKELYEKKCDRK
eukprot:SAG22_NODE_1685_length_3810_cov_28.206413_6_plen_139_part_01